jgi:Nidogen-like/PEP-CTERM motif
MKNNIFTKRVSTAVLSIVTLTMMAGTQEAQAQMRLGFDTFSLSRQDDGPSALTAIGFPVNFFSAIPDTDVWVNNNGNLTFGSSLSVYTPTGLTGATNRRTIAPFWGDVDTRNLASDVTKYGTGTVDRGPSGSPNIRNAFGVTWRDVGYYYPNPGFPAGSTLGVDKLNTFQAILIDRSDLGNCFEIEFNYEKIEWETGYASGGVGGLGGSSAVAGYSAGSGVPGTFFQLAGSGVNGGFLDSNLSTGLINTSNIGIVGRQQFLVHEGNVIGSTTAPEPGTFALLAIGGAGFIARLRRRKSYSSS